MKKCLFFFSLSLLIFLLFACATIKNTDKLNDIEGFYIVDKASGDVDDNLCLFIVKGFDEYVLLAATYEEDGSYKVEDLAIKMREEGSKYIGNNKDTYFEIEKDASGIQFYGKNKYEEINLHFTKAE